MPTPTAKYDIKAQDKSSKVISGIKGKLKGLSGAFGGMAGSIAGIVGVGGFGAMIKQSLDAADNIQKLSIRLGHSTEFLSEMGHAAQLGGSSLGAVEKGSKRLSQSIGDFEKGGKLAAESFADLGLNMEELIKLDADEQFLRVNHALAGMNKGSERTKKALDLLGRSGTEMLAVFDGGKDSIAAMRQEAKDLGISLTKDAADGAANANDAMLRLTTAFTGVGQALATDFAGPMVDIADSLRTNVIPVIRGLIDVVFGLAKAFGGAVAAAAAFFSGDFSGAGDIISDVGSDLFDTIGAAFGGGKDEAPATGKTGAPKDREQEKTRQKLDDQTAVMKEIAKNTRGVPQAVAG